MLNKVRLPVGSLFYLGSYPLDCSPYENALN